MSKSGRYGTAFEDIEDESGPIKKRPKRVHEEEVKDERGRRRFHGAFTGGFSAGYFNTVGSKHGFVPQTFKSSRNHRAEVQQFRPEDFMDEEDFGEFGIASRTFHVNRMYVDSGKPEGQAVWDRPSAPSAVASTTTGLSDFFHVSTKSESTSIGFQIMKKMGYREGKGIGAPLTRRQLELQKLHEDRARGKKSRFDKSAVEEADEFAAGFEFIPEDIPPVYFTCKENDHGLGYKPLKGFADGYQSTPVEKRTKRGDAFGVGVFEDSDEDIYDRDDMSKYTFALEKADIDPMLAITSGKPTFTTSFVAAKTPRKKPPHLTLRVPAGFISQHTPITFDASKLPDSIRSYHSSMTPFERAMILGEKNISVLDMLNKEDREKLRNARRLAEEKKAPEPIKQTIEDDPFIEDDEKSYRFKKYIQCLKRGVPCSKPEGLSSSQWQLEEIEFQNAVPSHLRYLLPDVRERKQPLYKGDFAKSIMEQMKSKFAAADDNKVIAVKPTACDPFTQLEWHPAKRLCKRLKVADPFPDSDMEGIFGAKSKTKISKRTYEFTKSQVEEELANRQDKHRHIKEEPKHVEPEPQEEATTDPDPLLKFLDLMDKVYGTTEQEIKEGEKLENEFHRPAPKPRQLSPVQEPSLKPAQPVNVPKFKSILDVNEEHYGPAIPDRLKNGGKQSAFKTEADIMMNYIKSQKSSEESESSSDSEREQSRAKSKKEKKERRKKHKEKKSKHKKKHKDNKKSKKSSRDHKKRKSKHRSRSSSYSSSSSVQIVD